MRAIEIEGGWGLDRLREVERPEPPPGPGRVALRIAAVSLNYRDLLTVQGHYNPRQALPLIPCSDGAGRIEAVGEGVEGLAVGDRVATLFAQGWTAGRPTRERLRHTLGGPLDGTLAQRIVLPADGVIPVPGHLTDAQAATLPCAALTAWSALVTYGQVAAGDTVLIQGTGGVSTFALQFAALHGARTIVTSSSDRKLERARELGAGEAVNYRETPDWSTRVMELTDGVGVDHVIEVGGAGTLQQSIDSVSFGGRISQIGVLSGVASQLNVVKLLMQQITLQGILVGHRDGFAAMNRAIESSGLQPVVDREFAFEEARAALEWMAAGSHLGKITIRI